MKNLKSQIIRPMIESHSHFHHSPTLIWNVFEPRSISMEKLMSSLSDSPLGASIPLPQMALFDRLHIQNPVYAKIACIVKKQFNRNGSQETSQMSQNVNSSCFFRIANVYIRCGWIENLHARGFLLAKYTISETQPLFLENTASSKFAFEELQILILSYGRIANPPKWGIPCLQHEAANRLVRARNIYSATRTRRTENPLTRV